MPNPAEQDIRAIIEDRVAAIRAKDAARAMRAIAEDVVAFELVPPLALPPGAACDEAAFAAWLARTARSRWTLPASPRGRCPPNPYMFAIIAVANSLVFSSFAPAIRRARS